MRDDLVAVGPGSHRVISPPRSRRGSPTLRVCLWRESNQRVPLLRHSASATISSPGCRSCRPPRDRCATSRRDRRTVPEVSGHLVTVTPAAGPLTRPIVDGPRCAPRERARRRDPNASGAADRRSAVERRGSRLLCRREPWPPIRTPVPPCAFTATPRPVTSCPATVDSLGWWMWRFRASATPLRTCNRPGCGSRNQHGVNFSRRWGLTVLHDNVAAAGLSK